jgi:SPP1 gp7 family putative phage head morphogenesis protein
MPDVTWGGLPYKEAIKFIQDKLTIPSDTWSDFIGPIHAKAFTVAGATKVDIVNDFHKSILDNIKNGGTITSFRKDFDAIVAKYGWSYNGKRGWRTSVIYNTNKRSAYMAGRWEQLQRVKSRRPYLIYMTVGDSRVRKEHQKWRMLALHIADPFWKTHFPPNGWLCRCYVRSASKEDLEEMGLSVGQVKESDLTTFDYEDPTTGEVFKKLPGIDIGWDYNVGQAWLAPEAIFGQQLMEVPAQMRAQALDWFDNSIYDDAFKSVVNRVGLQVAKGDGKALGLAQTAGFMTNDIIEYLNDQSIHPIGATIVATDKDIIHWLRSNKELRGQQVPLSIAAQFPAILRDPDVVLFDKNDPALIYAKHLGDGRYAKFIVKVNLKTKFRHIKGRFKEYLNQVRTAGIVKGYNLKDTAYELIKGDIEIGE